MSKEIVLVSSGYDMTIRFWTDLNENKWVPNGTKESTIYIATEQEEDELQTMMTAFISGVDEDHIINSKYV